MTDTTKRVVKGFSFSNTPGPHLPPRHTLLGLVGTSTIGFRTCLELKVSR